MLPTQPTEINWIWWHHLLCHCDHCDRACERLSTPSAPHRWCGSSAHPKAHLDFNSKMHGEKLIGIIWHRPSPLVQSSPSPNMFWHGWLWNLYNTDFVFQGRIADCENAHCVDASFAVLPRNSKHHQVLDLAIQIDKCLPLALAYQRQKATCPRRKPFLLSRKTTPQVAFWTELSNPASNVWHCLTFIRSWEAPEKSSNLLLTDAVKRPAWHKGKQLAALKLCVVLVFAAAGKGTNCLDVVLHLGKIKPKPKLALWRHKAGKQGPSSRCMLFMFLQ